MHDITIAYGKDFLRSFSMLPKAQQKKTEDFVEKFRENPDSPGINMEKFNSVDPNMRSVRIDKAYRGIDRPTDVLAFALREGMPMAGEVDALGDIVVAWPTARRQARAHGWSPEREVCLLVAHGLLHLLGFDHATRPTERRMMARAHMLMAAALPPSAMVDKPRRAPRGSAGQKPERHRSSSRKSK